MKLVAIAVILGGTVWLVKILDGSGQIMAATGVAVVGGIIVGAVLTYHRRS